MGMGMGKMRTLADAQEAAAKAVAAMGATSLADLRMRPAEDIQRDLRGAGLIVDGKYIPEDLSDTFARGKQKDVDLMVGSNKEKEPSSTVRTRPPSSSRTSRNSGWASSPTSSSSCIPRARTRRPSPRR
jgi:carboxylesterase type B